MADQDPWVEAAKSLKASPDAGTTTAVTPTKPTSAVANDPWTDAAKSYNATPDTPTTAPDTRSWLSKFLVPDAEQEEGYKDLTKGLGETLAQNVASGGELLGKIPLVGKLIAPDSATKTFQDLANPANNTQGFAKGVGNIGENTAVRLKGE